MRRVGDRPLISIVPLRPETLIASNAAQRGPSSRSMTRRYGSGDIEAQASPTMAASWAVRAEDHPGDSMTPGRPSASARGTASSRELASSLRYSSRTVGLDRIQRDVERTKLATTACRRSRQSCRVNTPSSCSHAEDDASAASLRAARHDASLARIGRSPDATGSGPRRRGGVVNVWKDGGHVRVASSA